MVVKRGRGRASATLRMIDTIVKIARAIQPTRNPIMMDQMICIIRQVWQESPATVKTISLPPRYGLALPAPSANIIQCPIP